MLPTMLIWSLPLLARAGFAENGPDPTGVGYSVSKYISNARATGLMAGCFQFPIMQMWDHHGITHFETNVMSSSNGRLHGVSFAALLAFQIAFGLFLAFPVTWHEELHMLSVIVFCVAGLAHFSVLYRLGDDEGLHPIAVFPLVIGVFGFVGVIFLVLISKAATLDFGMWFWAVECFGLTGMVWVTPASLAGEKLSTKLKKPSQVGSFNDIGKNDKPAALT